MRCYATTLQPLDLNISLVCIINSSVLYISTFSSRISGMKMLIWVPEAQFRENFNQISASILQALVNKLFCDLPGISSEPTCFMKALQLSRERLSRNCMPSFRIYEYGKLSTVPLASVFYLYCNTRDVSSSAASKVIFKKYLRDECFFSKVTPSLCKITILAKLEDVM